MTEQPLPKFRAILAKLFAGLTILLFVIGIIVLASVLYFGPYNYTYLLVIYCYLGLGIISAPLIGYYLVRATDIITFILLLLGICGFVLFSLFSLPLLFKIARGGDWVYYLMPYLGIYYLIFGIAFAISALIKRRVSTLKSLLPAIPLVTSIILSIISSVLSAIIMSIPSQYSYFAMIGLSVLTVLILGGIILFSVASMLRTIFTEANKQSA